MRTLPSLLRVIALLCLAVVAVSCSKDGHFKLGRLLPHSARHRTDGDVVRDIGFDGNGQFVGKALSGQSDYQLRSQLTASKAPFGAFTFPFDYFQELEPFHAEILSKDAYKLEVWYAHHGWFDAKVVGWEIRRVHPQRKRKAGVVDITGYLDPGPRSTIRAFKIDGADTNTSLIAHTVERVGFVHAHDLFDLQTVFDTRDLLLAQLKDHGFAYASVVVDIDAYPETHTVDVTLHLTPGILAIIGPITVSGNKAVDESVIRDVIRLDQGEAYRFSDILSAQRHLFDMGLFSMVTVSPHLDDPTLKEIPVDVSVSESLFRTLRLGGGVDYDGQFKPRVSGTFRHMNLFGDLIRFELHGEYGYATRASGAGTEIVAKVKADLSQPRLFDSRRFGVLTSVGIERNLQNAEFPFLRPTAAATLTWRPKDAIVATFGPHLEQYRYLDFQGPAAFAAKSLFGDGFRNPYTLTTLDANLVIDWRKGDTLSPTGGTISTLGLRQAVPFRADDFFYTEFDGDWHGYWSPKTHDLAPHVKGDKESPSWGATAAHAVGRGLLPEVIALRGHGKVLFPEAGRALPYPERAFLGGPTDMRGFRTDQIGPNDCVCLYQPARSGGFDIQNTLDSAYNGVRRFLGQNVPPRKVTKPGDPFTGVPGTGQDVQQIYLPQGGAFAAATSLELRYDLRSDITGVAFVDAGLLEDTLNFKGLGLADFRVGYGFGFRYSSPIGPIRLDSTFRPIYPEDWGPQEYINCRLADRVPRAFDLLSTGVGNRDLTGRSTPFAWNIFLGIGQAI